MSINADFLAYLPGFVTCEKNIVYLLYVPRRFNTKKFTFCQQNAIFCVILISEKKVIFPASLSDF